MDLTLTRFHCCADGIFGRLFAPDGHMVAVTLEHAFPSGSTFAPIIPHGTYACELGTHQLSNGVPFETYEITGVEGHTGLLFHAGNFNKDSHGCILLGQDCSGSVEGEMVTNSKATFAQFMALQAGIPYFTLTVNSLD